MFNWILKKIAGFVDVSLLANEMSKSFNKEEILNQFATNFDVKELAGHINISDIANEFDSGEIASHITVSAKLVADELDVGDVANYLSLNDLAEELDISDIASELDISDIASEINVSDIAGELDVDDIIKSVGDSLDYKQLAKAIIEVLATKNIS